jgi:hypothetical protein
VPGPEDEAASRDEGAGARLVRALFLAQDAGRIEEMLTFVHPQITVRPMTRPGRGAYIGHDDFRLLVTDLRRALGPVRVRWDDVTEHDDGTVTANGAQLVRVYGEEQEQQRFRCEFTFRDGLLFTFDSYPAAPKST